MLTDILMPQLGESITEGTIIQWKKKIGESVEKDEVLLEIGTDKVDSEIPSPVGGVLKEILAKPNDVFPVNEVIARIESSSEKKIINENEIEEKQKISEKDKKEDLILKIDNNNDNIASVSENIKIEIEQKNNHHKKTFFTPLVRSIARKKKLSEDELYSIEGSGQLGRVTKNDLLKFLESKNNHQTKEHQTDSISEDIIINNSQMDDSVEEMDRMRQMIAKHMRESIDTSAHVYLASECDMSNIVKFVTEKKPTFLKKEGFKLTYTPFLIYAVVKTIKSLPQFNSHLNGINIIHKKNINIGMAVALEKGLMVPVLSNCDELNFLGICRKVNDLATRSRINKIKPNELSGSTFTITNFGIFGCVFGLPIINQPNSAILGVGAIKKRPVVIESNSFESIAIRSICNFSLGIDHRLLDGSDGGKFLKHFVSVLEGLDTGSLL